MRAHQHPMRSSLLTTHFVRSVQVVTLTECWRNIDDDRRLAKPAIVETIDLAAAVVGGGSQRSHRFSLYLVPLRRQNRRVNPSVTIT